MLGQLAIIWHSRTGAAQALAEAAADGAGALGRLIPARRAMPQDLLDAAGYLFVCPENLGSMTGTMKELFDRSYYPLLGQIEGRPYATMISAGSSGTGAQAQLDRIVTGWRLRRVAEPVIVNLAVQTPDQILAPKVIGESQRQAAFALGEALAESIRIGLF